MQVTLPWPPKILSPNARPHHMAKARAVKEYRGVCRIFARQIRPIFTNAEIGMTITFNPPNNRRRDRDNLIAAMKSGMDGVAEAWGVDDSRFVPTYRMGPPVKHGQVVIEVTP